MSTSLRVTGLLLLALLASWLILRGCTREPQTSEPPAPPAREAFHASRPLVLDFKTDAQVDRDWMSVELRSLLTRGKMHLAAIGAPAPAEGASATGEPFALRIEVRGGRALLTLAAPDGVVERELGFDLERTSRLQIMRTFAAQLPPFLTAPEADWSALLGFTDERNYDAFTRAAAELLGPDSIGFTRAEDAVARARTVERLEALRRQDGASPRVATMLALGYLTVGGEDATSLTNLAEAAAEHALNADPAAPGAQAALGLVALRRGEWLAAHERFSTALQSDANDVAALEGLSCLLVDAGHHRAARPFAQRAVTLQPKSVGANECLAYAAAGGAAAALSEAKHVQPAAAQIIALEAILAGDFTAAERWQRAALPRRQFDAWGQPLLRAANSNRQVAEALRAITGAASEGQIDASTEILCGVALRQSEFVFNRMARLQRQREHAPLRLLWLPQTAFLREHARFEETVSAAGLPAFWQQQGPPEVCEKEPAVYGCATRSAARVDRR